MSKLKQWIRNWLKDDNSQELACVETETIRAADGLHCYQKKTVTFTINKAVGGAIVQSRIYERFKDEEKVTLYIIKEEEEFTEAFSQIVSLEYLKI